MSNYQDEIFSYLTKRENFLSSYEIYQIFPEIKRKLIEQFWLKVMNELKAKCKDSGYYIGMSENVFDTYSALWISIDENDPFCVAIEKLHGLTYYGLWIDPDTTKDSRAKINEYIEKTDEFKKMKKNEYWLGYIENGDNFSDIETLQRIIPENNDEYANDISKQIFDFFNSVKDKIIEIKKMLR